MKTASESIQGTPTRRRRGYWQAEGLIADGLSRFQRATTLGDPAKQRNAFYRLAHP